MDRKNPFIIDETPGKNFTALAENPLNYLIVMEVMPKKARAKHLLV